MKQSARLKLLDVRGWRGACVHLQPLPVTDLQHLYVARSSYCDAEGVDILLSKVHYSMSVTLCCMCVHFSLRAFDCGKAALTVLVSPL